MTLYVHDKRAKRFKPLSAIKIKKMRRVTEVKELSKAAKRSAATMLALACWMEQVDLRGRRFGVSDLVVTKLPNCNRIRQLADDMLLKAWEADNA